MGTLLVGGCVGAVLAGLAAALGLVFFFILALDHPFAGKESVTSEPFALVVESMDRWDAAEHARAPAGAPTAQRSPR